jgi:hypothetical protein
MFIFMEQDNFAFKTAQSTGFNNTKPGTSYFGAAAIRRPHRGIQIKEDTYSVITIRKADGFVVPLISESSLDHSKSQGWVGEYADYILQQVSDQRMEKQQIIETFGESYVFFFGERPRIMTFSGQLVNTEDFNWRSQFWKNYDEYLRGTKLVQMNARAYITFDSIIVEGYPLSAQATDSADTPYQIPFQLTMLVTNSYDFSDIGQTVFPGEKLKPSDIASRNFELKNSRSNFISTTAAVRRKNVFATGGGVLSMLRSGIKTANEILSLDFLGDWSKALSGMLGGRVVRMPIGVAGYLSQVGDQTTLAAGSLDAFTQTAFDAKTGEYKTITGSVKLRLPAYSEFAPVDPAKIRSYKSDNYDEYPLAKDKSLLELLGSKAGEETIRINKQKSEIAQRDYNLQMWNGIAEGRSTANDIADIIGILKDGFGTVMNGIGITRDFKGYMQNRFQLAGIMASFKNSWQPFNRGMFNYTREGKPTEVGSIPTTGYVSKYIGKAAIATFDESATAAAANVYIDPVTGMPRPVPVPVGDAYKGSSYVKTTAQTAEEAGLNYEAVYADSDYTSVTDKSNESDPTELYVDNDYVKQTEAMSGKTEDPAILYGKNGYINQADRANDSAKAIEEIYGNKGYAPTTSQVSEAELEALYSPTGDYRETYVSKTLLSYEERLALLQEYNLENEEPPAAEDTRGIRSAADEDGPLEPIV